MNAEILDDRVVIVTGAGRGIGLAMSRGLIAAGANVALLDIDDEVMSAAASMEPSATGGETLAIRCDVTDPIAVQAASNQILDHWGRMDVLINNAVVGPEQQGSDFINTPPKFWDVEDGLWRRMLEVNVWGPQLMAKTVLPHMIEKGAGRLINITTSLDTMYRPGVGGYGACKAALEAHTLVMAQDLDGTGVTANALLPGGPVNTRMIPEASGVPRDQLIQPEVMVGPAVWLSSKAADGVNGLRIVAAFWDEGLEPAARLEKASAPLAWQQLGAQAVNPKEDW